MIIRSVVWDVSLKKFETNGDYVNELKIQVREGIPQNDKITSHVDLREEFFLLSVDYY